MYYLCQIKNRLIETWLDVKIKIMTNQDFCYWLQGYFEISQEPDLTKDKILIIQAALMSITEPLGYFTQWLSGVISYLTSVHYKPELLMYFLPDIISELNAIFVHVIDASYDLNISLEEAKRIHDGLPA